MATGPVTVTTMEHVQTTSRGVYALLLRNRRALRDALIIIGLLRAGVYFFVQDIHPWTFVGIDARAYYAVDLAHPYIGAALGQHPGYLYSPAFAQFLSPLYVLPFEAFYVLWTILFILSSTRPAAAMAGAHQSVFLPWTYELFVGHVDPFFAAVLVLGFRWPALRVHNPDQGHAGGRPAVVPGASRMACARHRAGHDASDRRRLVRAQPNGMVRVVRLAASERGWR